MHDLRADAPLRKYFQQNGVLIASINNMGLLNTAIQGLHAASHFRDHTTTYGSIFKEPVDLFYLKA